MSTSQPPLDPTLWRAAAVLGGLAVIAGAFGAHGLEQRGVDPAGLAAWKTGAQYLQLHALVALALALAAPRLGRAARVGGWLMLVGGVLFAGSIFLLVLGVGPRALLGPTTPLGGSLMIAGWFSLLAVRTAATPED